LPEPIALYPLNEQYGAKDISPAEKTRPGKRRVLNLHTDITGNPRDLSTSPGHHQVLSSSQTTEAWTPRYSMTFAAWIHPENSAGPLFNYKVNDRGVYVWLESPNKLVAKFEIRDSSQPYAIQSDRIRLKMWNYVAANLRSFGWNCQAVDRRQRVQQSHHIGCYADKSSPAISSLEEDQTCWNGLDAIQDSCFRILQRQIYLQAEAQAVCRTEKATLAKLKLGEIKNYFACICNWSNQPIPSSSCLDRTCQRDCQQRRNFIGQMELPPDGVC
ncbi:hypothetical protein OS493_040572, partial [Desmophyllum pertusum]